MNDKMNKLTEDLKQNIANATSVQDLLPIMSTMELEELKQFLSQRILESNEQVDTYFKSTSIIDIFGEDDVTNHCLKYLSTQELYHTKSVCKTFKKVNESILSSNEIYANYEKLE